MADPIDPRLSKNGPERFRGHEDGGAEAQGGHGFRHVHAGDAVQAVPDALPHVNVAEAPNLGTR